LKKKVATYFVLYPCIRVYKSRRKKNNFALHNSSMHCANDTIWEIWNNKKKWGEGMETFIKNFGILHHPCGSPKSPYYGLALINSDHATLRPVCDSGATLILPRRLTKHEHSVTLTNKQTNPPTSFEYLYFTFARKLRSLIANYGQFQCTRVRVKESLETQNSRCISRAKAFPFLWNLRNCKWRHAVCFPLISRN
jgi:hypothetical protein